MTADFPAMIFHPAHSPIVVNTAEEMQTHLLQGWSKVPIEQTQEGMLQAKINWHMAEAIRLQKILDDMTPKEEEEELVCDLCGFKAKNQDGMVVHKGRKHKEGKQ